MSQRPTIVTVYDQPHQFEPLLPQEQASQGLTQRADDVAQAALRLQGGVHPATLAALRELVRAMNAYYSNRIEGQSTHPLNIAKALRADFSVQPDIARRQRLALAHMQAEAALEHRVTAGENALASPFTLQAHHELYSRLPAGDRVSDQAVPVVPGHIRERDVGVYRHQPPTATSLPRFMRRFDEGYAQRKWLMCELPWVVACAHHRMAWIHPFIDGNGRAVRLQTHAALWPLSAGLWSVNRGLARRRDDYYRLLSEADMSRQGDLDGRGNLSQRNLVAWCDFFLDVCADQIDFMSRMLDLAHMKLRISQLVAARARLPGKDTIYRPQVELPLHHVFAAGPVSRGEFQQMTGLAQRTAVRVLGGLLQDGIVISESRHAPVRFGLPLDALHLLWPGLYPEAAGPVEDGA